MDSLFQGPNWPKVCFNEYHFQNTYLSILCNNLYVTISASFPQEIVPKVDTNEDGDISATEIVERCFAEIDADQNGKVSKEEFVNACLKSKDILCLLAPIRE